MTLVLSPSSDYYFGFTMPCGFHGDSVDFDSVAVESEFCAGDWALPSPVCTQNSSQSQQQPVLGSLHNLDIVGQAAFAFAAEPRRVTGDVDDSSLVTEELKSRLLGDKMETDDDFDDVDGSKRSKGDRKQQEEEEEEEEELFFQPPRRISMLWNSKLRWKEERKKVLKISINKLRRIEDPEVFLCRSVLINNTVRRLHREIREEKMARYPEVHRPVPVSSCSLVTACHNGNIPETFPSRKRQAPSSCSSSSTSSSSASSMSISASLSSLSSNSLLLDCKENGGATVSACYSNKENLQEDVAEQDADGAPPGAKRMRTSDAVASTDFCSQTTAEGAACRQSPANRHGATTTSPGGGHLAVSGACALTSGFASNDRIKAKCDQSPPRAASPGGDREDRLLTESALQQNAAKERSRGLLVSEYEKQYSQYSCGQLSIFGELQSVVFHSLIASLES